MANSTILKIVKSPHQNERSPDFDETWASVGRMCEPISLKIGRLNFTALPIYLRWAVAMAIPVA